MWSCPNLHVDVIHSADEAGICTGRYSLDSLGQLAKPVGEDVAWRIRAGDCLESSDASMSVAIGARRVYRTEFVELVVRLVGGDQPLEIGFVPMNPRLAWPTYDNARDLREALEARGLRTGHDG